MKKWFREHKGLTLIEMMVVLAILAVLAAIIVPAVTGMTTKSRATTQMEDLNQVQSAIDRFNSEDTDGKPWPTKASIVGIVGTAWVAGNLPVATITAEAVGTGDGTETVFTLDYPPVVANSQTVKVGVTTLTEGAGASNYTFVDATGVITFGTAPATGAAITANYTMAVSGSGTSASPYVFSQDHIAGIDWDSVASTDDGSKTFYDDYIRTKPRHAGDADISIAAGATYPTTGSIAVQKGSSVIYVQLKNTSSGTLSFPLWAVDRDGVVWVFVDKDVY